MIASLCSMSKLVWLRTAIATALVASLIVSVFVSVSAPAGAVGKHANIILILTDDQRLEDIKHMPKLNQLLVDQGMIFQNYFSTVSLCCPSRTSILRGQYAHNTGVLTNQLPNGGFTVAHARGIENSTIATWLHDAGYRTALFGKYLNKYPGNLTEPYVPPGWDRWASPVAGRPYSEYNYVLNEDGKTVRYGAQPGDYGTDVYTGKAVEFIKDCCQKKAPFFLYLAFYAPHSPATPAPRHMNLFGDAQVNRSKAFNEADVSAKPQYIRNQPLMNPRQIARTDQYYGLRLRSLQAVDEAIETLYKTLSAAKQLDNTYIFFVSDNGFHLGEHRMLRGKQTAYETDIHLPLIVRGPGIKPGTSCQAIAGNIDLAPTFTALAGATAPDFVDGRSLVDLLRSKDSAKLKWRKVYLVEHWNGRRRQAAPADSDDNKGAKTTTNIGIPLDQEGHLLSQSSQPPSISAASSAELAFVDETDDQLNDDEDNVDITDITGKHDSHKLKIAQKRQKPGQTAGQGNQPDAAEMGGIPEFHGLRGATSTYVEYVTGEREFYRLTDDADQINNLAHGKTDQDLAAHSQRVKDLAGSAASGARKLEEAP